MKLFDKDAIEYSRDTVVGFYEDAKKLDLNLMSFDFENQNIIIFGGSNGVGLHLAKSLIESG